MSKHEDFIKYLNKHLMTKGEVLTKYGIKTSKFDSDVNLKKISKVTTIGKVNLYDKQEMEKFYGGKKK